MQWTRKPEAWGLIEKSGQRSLTSLVKKRVFDKQQGPAVYHRELYSIQSTMMEKKNIKNKIMVLFPLSPDHGCGEEILLWGNDLRSTEFVGIICENWKGKNAPSKGSNTCKHMKWFWQTRDTERGPVCHSAEEGRSAQRQTQRAPHVASVVRAKDCAVS